MHFTLTSRLQIKVTLKKIKERALFVQNAALYLGLRHGPPPPLLSSMCTALGVSKQGLSIWCGDTGIFSEKGEELRIALLLCIEQRGRFSDKLKKILHSSFI